jgi:hypothetical protein
MPKPPPPAIRYLVLLGAVALLVTAVCTKTDNANEPEPPMAPVVFDAMPAAVEEVVFDAAPAAEMQQAVQPPANPAVKIQKSPNAKNPAPENKGNRTKPKEEFFPASKSGGMF